MREREVRELRGWKEGKERRNEEKENRRSCEDKGREIKGK